MQDLQNNYRNIPWTRSLRWLSICVLAVIVGLAVAARPHQAQATTYISTSWVNLYTYGDTLLVSAYETGERGDRFVFALSITDGKPISDYVVTAGETGRAHITAEERVPNAEDIGQIVVTSYRLSGGEDPQIRHVTPKTPKDYAKTLLKVLDDILLLKPPTQPGGLPGARVGFYAAAIATLEDREVKMFLDWAGPQYSSTIFSHLPIDKVIKLWGLLEAENAVEVFKLLGDETRAAMLTGTPTQTLIDRFIDDSELSGAVLLPTLQFDDVDQPGYVQLVDLLSVNTSFAIDVVESAVDRHGVEYVNQRIQGMPIAEETLIFEESPITFAGALIEEMPSDHAAELLSAVDPQRAAALISRMSDDWVVDTVMLMPIADLLPIMLTASHRTNRVILNAR